MSIDDRFDNDDIEAIDKYWQERPQSFSAKVLEELLAGGPAEQVLPLPKTPGARIAVARTVMAASDQKIRDLQDALNTMKRERDRSFATWVAVAINKPLFAKGSDPASTQVKATAETEQKKLDEDEYRFFLRYLKHFVIFSRS
jgi:CHASE2 domain-containing sensor protein